MKSYAVRLTDQALLDLEDIARYIAFHDAPEKADYVGRKIEEAVLSLALLPNRGAHPRELLEVGNRHFREIYFKPYRILYRVYDQEVVVFLIADGRRDMRALLERRRLGA